MWSFDATLTKPQRDKERLLTHDGTNIKLMSKCAIVHLSIKTVGFRQPSASTFNLKNQIPACPEAKPEAVFWVLAANNSGRRVDGEEMHTF